MTLERKELVSLLREELARFQFIPAHHRVALSKAVREEIRIAGLLDMPGATLDPQLPCDIRLEQEVLSAMFENIAPPAFLAPEHFYMRLHEALFEPLKLCVEKNYGPHERRVAFCIEAIHALGYDSTDIANATRGLCDETPVCTHMGRAAVRLRKLAVQRDVVRMLASLRVELHAPDVDVAILGRKLQDTGARLIEAQGDAVL